MLLFANHRLLVCSSDIVPRRLISNYAFANVNFPNIGTPTITLTYHVAHSNVFLSWPNNLYNSLDFYLKLSCYYLYQDQV